MTTPTTKTTTDLLRNLREYLTWCNNARKDLPRLRTYPGYESYTLIHGVESIGSGDPGVERGRMQNCYSNAFHWVFDRTGHHPGGPLVPISDPWYYCEGWAMTPRLAIPIQHAWASRHRNWSPLPPQDTKDFTFDPTWNDPEAVYFGVPMQLEFVVQRITEQGYYGVMVNDWQHGCVMLDANNANRILTEAPRFGEDGPPWLDDQPRR